MLSPASIQPWIQTISVAVAAIGLVITMWNTFATRRAAETSTIFDLWSRYERYRAALDDVADETFAVARGPFLDLANFIEHLCYLINRRAVPRVVRRNLESLVLDYLAVTNRRSGTSYGEVLGAFRLSSNTYADTAMFIRRHRAALIKREQAASEAAYGPFKSSSMDSKTAATVDQPDLPVAPIASEPSSRSLRRTPGEKETCHVG